MAALHVRLEQLDERADFADQRHVRHTRRLVMRQPRQPNCKQSDPDRGRRYCREPRLREL